MVARVVLSALLLAAGLYLALRPLRPAEKLVPQGQRHLVVYTTRLGMLLLAAFAVAWIWL
jgi:hypothetical protein